MTIIFFYSVVQCNGFILEALQEQYFFSRSIDVFRKFLYTVKTKKYVNDLEKMPKERNLVSWTKVWRSQFWGYYVNFQNLENFGIQTLSAFIQYRYLRFFKIMLLIYVVHSRNIKKSWKKHLEKAFCSLIQLHQSELCWVNLHRNKNCIPWSELFLSIFSNSLLNSAWYICTI
jgi:hypothetical protein